MFQEILPKIFAFLSKNQGSNCFLLLGKKETTLFDSSTAENKHAVLKGLAGLGLQPANITLILHTHGHADHFGLDKAFPNAKIAMHSLDARQINKGNKAFACANSFLENKLPNISLFLKDSQEIDLGGLALKAIHTPGHTEGSLCFFLAEEKALFSGDTLFKHGFGRTDLSGGNAQKMVESLLRLQKTPFRVLLPGHGPILVGEEQNRASLKETIAVASTNAFL